MAINEQDKITVPFANSGLRNDIPETATGSNLASMQEGFPAVTMTDIASGGQPPDGKDFNGILNVITKILQYTQSGGLYKYDSDYATAMGGYPVGAILRSADGSKIWMNTTANNSSDPDNGGQNWAELTNASALASAISTVEGLVSAEATARANAVSAEATARANAVSAEATARANAVSAEATARANAVSALQSSKQNNLTFDSTPTAGSSNPVTSGGIKTAIDNIDALPSQTGNAGKVLGTDGTSASWVSPPSGRNLHEWVWSSLPLTDAGLHLADGAFIPFGGVYDKWARDVERIKNAGLCPDSFVTQAEFDASVSAYGSCGKFVVSASGVRLPKVSDILQGTTDLSAVGNLVEAGLPNIVASGFLHSNDADGIASGAVRYTRSIYKSSAQFPDTARTFDTQAIEIDASISSPYYRDDVTKPTPQTIKSLLYICVATSVKTPVEVEIDSVMTDVNNKLDRDLSNVVGDAVERVVEQGYYYIRYSSGKQICWGDWTIPSGVREKTINFPKNFITSKGLPKVMATVGTWSTDTVNTYGADTTNFVVAITVNKSVTTFEITGTYIAIGNWK